MGRWSQLCFLWDTRLACVFPPMSKSWRKWTVPFQHSHPQFISFCPATGKEQGSQDGGHIQEIKSTTPLFHAMGGALTLLSRTPFWSPQMPWLPWERNCVSASCTFIPVTKTNLGRRGPLKGTAHLPLVREIIAEVFVAIKVTIDYNCLLCSEHKTSHCAKLVGSCWIVSSFQPSFLFHIDVVIGRSAHNGFKQ